MNSAARYLVFFIDIKHDQGMEVAVPNMADDRVVQTDRLEVFLGLKNELGKLRHGNAEKVSQEWRCDLKGTVPYVRGPTAKTWIRCASGH